MNRTVTLLMLSDIFIITGFGLMEPILAIFIKENLIGGTIFGAGLASAIFLTTKSIVQLPFSKYVDTHENKVRWLIVGAFLVALVPIIYIFSKHIYHIYVAQFIFGIGSGLAYPAWLSLWSINLDRRHEGYEWSLYSTLSGIGAATTAAIGAAIAEFIGFTYTFLMVGMMSLIGVGILLFLHSKHKNDGFRKQYYKRRKLVEQE